MKYYSRYFKRIIDIVVSSALLIIFLPLMITISLIILIVDKTVPFYLQQRPGKLDKIFCLYKFKSMVEESKGNIDGGSANSRITKIGRVIRATSIDELPQLFNVLRGDMSLIGPRPLLVEYLPLYTSEQKQRHLVKPGITGWAQVNGRNSSSWEAKFKNDIYYVENCSLRLDIKILFLTVKKVILREGIQTNENVTMQKYKGVIEK